MFHHMLHHIIRPQYRLLHFSILLLKCQANSDCFSKIWKGRQMALGYQLIFM